MTAFVTDHVFFYKKGKNKFVCIHDSICHVFFYKKGKNKFVYMTAFDTYFSMKREKV